jgi:CHAP domain-containing protein
VSDVYHGRLQGRIVSMDLRGRVARHRPLAGLVLVAFLGVVGMQMAAAPSRVAAAPLVAHAYPGGGMMGFGDVNQAPPSVPEPVNAPILTGAATPDGDGYWLVSADGGVFASGDATYEGSLGNLPLQGPIIAMAATPDGHGYWLGALDGGVFALGDAPYLGSMGGTRLNQPIVGMASTPDGRGYWLVASDGGIFSFGDAVFHGSTGGIRLNQPIVGMAVTPDGGGYWLVASDGGIFSFGDAGYYGSWAQKDLPDPVVGIVRSPDGLGYAISTANGVVLALGDAQAFGGLTLSPDATPVSAIIGNGSGTGYWLLSPDAWNYTFSTPTPEGSFPGSDAIVAAVASQVAPDPDTGYYCNPYGPCEEWCALFATWAWQQGGVPIPSYAFTGSMYDWAAANGIVLPPSATPDPGDAVLYGTGPQNVGTSVHVGIVTQVWPDGSIDTVDGDSGPGRDGWLSVTINGPFLPADSLSYNGDSIYAFVRP